MLRNIEVEPQVSTETTIPITEQAPQKELETQLACVITISGPAGTGKTTTANLLVEALTEYTGKKITFLKVGEKLVREPYRDSTGREVVGKSGQTADMDKQIDDTQIALIHETPEDEMLVLEGWLSGVVATEEKQKAKLKGETPPQAVSFLLYADYEERIDRAFKREFAKNPQLTKEQFKKDTRARELDNFKRWKKQHTQLKGVHIFGKENQDNQENKIYDYVVDTTKLSVEDVCNGIMNMLIEDGKIRAKQSGPATTEQRSLDEMLIGQALY